MQAGRLANVAGALLVPEEGGSPRTGDAAERAELEVLRALCEETLALADERLPAGVSRVVPLPAGPRSPLADLVALLEAAAAERLLVLWPGGESLPEDLPAALSAWPPRDGVRIDAEVGQTPLCAIFRREPALEQARAALRAGGRDLSALDDRLDIERTTPVELGLSDGRTIGAAAGR